MAEYQQLKSSSRSRRSGWYLYDWANSPFSTSVATLFFGPYLTLVGMHSSLGGMRIAPESVYPYALSLSLFLSGLAFLYLSGVSESARRSRQWLGVWAYTGAAATISMYWIETGRVVLGALLFLVANTSFYIARVFYNALLPLIAEPQELEAVSGKGWVTGYLGGGLLLGAHLWLLGKAQDLAISAEQAVRIALASSGVWWALFTFVALPAISIPHHGEAPGGNLHHRDWFWLTQELRLRPDAARFLVARALYMDGIQATLAMATLFGQQELKLSMETLAAVILMNQFVGILGPFLFHALARLGGPKQAMQIALGAWMLILLYIYLFTHSKAEFFVAAGIIAVLIGGTESVGRGWFAAMIPEGQETKFFSLYELAGVATSWLGPVLFGLTLQFTRSYRLAVLLLVIFFAAGSAVLFQMRNTQPSSNPAG